VPSSRLPTALAIAVGFGCLTAGLVNLAEHPAARLGGYLLNAGWAWAGLSVLAGALVVRPVPGAVTGWLAAGVALFAFDATDAVVHHASLGSALRADLSWWAVSLLFCPLLGLVGSTARRPGRSGLLARLVVPAGAALEMVVRPPGGGLQPEALWAQVTVWVLAALCTVVLLGRHRRAVTT
jgi:hypothetical protein